MRTLYKHIHLVIDEKNEYLDAALLINDKFIEDVFIHSNKINENIIADEEIDCQSKIFIPCFFDPKTKNQKQIDVAKSYEYNKNPKVLNNPLSYDVDNIEIIDDISLSNQLIFNDDQAINYAFYSNVPVLFGIDDSIGDNYIKFVVKNIEKNKLMLISYNHDNIIDQVKRLFNVGISLTDIVAYTSSNAYSIYGSKLDGSLIKGKIANIICLDSKCNKVFTIKEGVRYD